jgi:Transposase DDE domain
MFNNMALPNIVRRCGLRRCRYIGSVKALLQHLLTATAFNLARLTEGQNDLTGGDHGDQGFARLSVVVR